MDKSNTFVGLDVHKATIAVAVARDGGPVQSLGTIAHTPQAVAGLLKRLAKDGGRLHVCYEAGPFGYGLHRQITALGHRCDIIAPSLIPKKPGERIKTDRRDARKLTELLRAGLLTDIWVPDEAHEAMRDLVRSRAIAADDYRKARQQVLAFLLRHGRAWAGKTWTRKHRLWLAAQKFAHPGQHLAFEELLARIDRAEAFLARMDKAIAETVATWSLQPVVSALMTLRGVSLLTAATLVVEIGDFRRFESPRALMSYLGLVPSEQSSGGSIRRGGIAKTGNSAARRVLVEAAWTYRHPARIGKGILARQAGQPEAVRAIAWKAQGRLCGRYRRLTAGGKAAPKAIVAIARELAGFVWAIAWQVQPAAAI